MKRIKKWRYYCDFCKKSGAHGGYMKKHEISCTMNPNRICNMCQCSGEEQPLMTDMLKVLDTATIKHEVDKYGESYILENEVEILEKLREIANYCPICIFSALRQHGYLFLFSSFDFKKEKEEFWRDINAEYNNEDSAHCR